MDGRGIICILRAYKGRGVLARLGIEGGWGALEYFCYIHICIVRDVAIDEGGDNGSFFLENGEYVSFSLVKVVSFGDVGGRN